MNKAKQSVDLSGRRRRLGASRETMAAGLGLPVDTVKAIEDGTGSDQEHDQYDTWLGRIENWQADERARQFLTAGKGGRFESKGEE